MALLSLAGPSSGIDVNQVATQQLNVEKQSVVEQRLPQTAPAAANTPAPVQTSLSAQGKLQSSLSAYVSAAQQLSRDAASTPTVASSSQPDSVSASSDGSAQAGSHLIEVNGLASAQSVTSASFSGVGTVIGLGTLHIELGSWNSSQTAFSTNPNWPKSDVRVGPRDTSLEKVRDKINAAGVGVVASVISDATGSRLVLRSTSTGSENGFKVSATDETSQSKAANAGLAALTFDPSLNQLNMQQGMQQTQAAADAKAKVDGADVTSSTNTVTDAVKGLSLKLSKVTDAPVEVTVAPDKEALKKSASDFAKAYNELGALGQTPAAGLGQQLSSIGLDTDAEGAMRVDNNRLDLALTLRPDQVKDVFTAASQQARSTEADSDGQRGDNADTPSYAAKLLSQYRALEAGSSPAGSASVN